MPYPNTNDRRPDYSSQPRPNATVQTPLTQQIDGNAPYDPVEVGKKLVAQLKSDGLLRDFTTSQLRKVLSSANVVKNKIDRENQDSDMLISVLQEEIQYLRLRLVYQMGRDVKVKTCLSAKGVDLPTVIQNIGNSKARFNNFYRLLESIVAYRKFEGE